MYDENLYLLQKVDNCLKLMCGIMKVYRHPVYQDSLVLTNEIEEIEADLISGITTSFTTKLQSDR